jgi:PAS domain S-box-containing protein
MHSTQPLQRTWKWLISPAVPIERSDQLNQHRLLAGVLLTLLSITLGYLIFSHNFAFYDAWTDNFFGLITMALLGIAFWLNRAGKRSAAAWVTVVFTSLIILGLSFTSNDYPPDLEFLDFLFLPMLIASLFLAAPVILLLGAACISVIFLLAVGVYHYDLVAIAGGPVFYIFLACGLIYIITRHRDSLERDRQRELFEKEERYRILLETSYEGICVTVAGRIVEANPNLARLFGAAQINAIIGEPFEKYVPLSAAHRAALTAGSLEGQFAITQGKRHGAAQLYIEVISRTQIYHGQPANVIALRDVTAKVLAEEALDCNERLFRTLFENANDAIFLINLDNLYTRANQKAAELLGYSMAELIGMPISAVVAPGEYTDSLDIKRALLEGRAVPMYERNMRRKDGSVFPAEVNVTLVRDKNGCPEYIQSIVRDIAERRQKDARLKIQLEHLQTLREIDRLITSGPDMVKTLNGLLEHVVRQLAVDAAVIYHPNRSSGQLEILADCGMPMCLTCLAPITRADPLAGQAAALSRRVMLPELGTLEDPRLITLVENGFHSGFAIPLIAKGVVNGVLEVYLRTAFEPPEEWMDFFETLAGQAAIAMDSAELFQDLQRTNLELTQAIDATLEGWAGALEMRDKETEGHMQRVTHMSVELGRMMGLDADALVYLRRGALLHDIGKMGVPDAILLKPGPLTPEEWEIMKQHPVNAYNWVRSISFLKQAVDIPHYHHERWNGSGYPLGLKGEEIPLGARIFAVVDVWDALLSARPYKDPWPVEKVKANLLENAGILFDPAVVEKMIEWVELHPA